MEDEHYHYGVEELIARYPALSVCKESILDAYKILETCFATGHKLLICGNGGSCADSEHICGELMKGFKKRRRVSEVFSNRLKEIDPVRGQELSDKLQEGLPCIALDGHQGLNTAFTNDVENGGLLTFAQQVNVFGTEGDVLLGISTSGNSKNTMYAAVTAKAKGLKVIGLTGEKGGELSKIADVAIKAPSGETFMIQEYHLPIYHCLCLMLEERFY